MTDIKVCENTKPEEVEFIKKMAKDSSLFAGEVESITYMPGGLTNRNFKTVVDGKTYAFRIAGEGTAEYLNRPAERQAVHAIKDLGISPEFYYYDLETGSNICRFCEGPTMKREDFQTRSNILEKSAAIIKKYHNSGIIQKGIFDPMAEIKSYLQWLKDNNCSKYYDGMDVLVSTLEEIDAQFAKNPPKKVFSHNDALSENFIYDDKNDKLELIDWEYCGMNVYNFDVAAVVIENKLNKEKEEEFLKYYYEGELNEQNKADVLIGKFLVDALWCPWALVQLVSKPDEEEFYWQYGLERITRCNEYMADPNFKHYVAMIAE
ncbi:MAG: choline kinase family protein [Clostridiales bacterium]